ncbi:MAG: hypothetical protein H5T81_09595 [Tetrasphaera sp.]|nr:hypothetical protein [Tetrasphaera sp.]
MALAPSWDTTAVPGLRAPGLPLPARRKPAIPVYPAGRHRGAHLTWFAALAVALTPRRRYVGRHRPGWVSGAYSGRHRS